MSDATPAVTPEAAPTLPTKTFSTPAQSAAPRARQHEARPGDRTTNKAAALIAKHQAKAAETEAPKTDEGAPAEAPADASKAEPKTADPEAKPDQRKEEFAAIARAEKRIRAEREAIEKERQAFAAEREQLTSTVAKAREIQALIDAGDKLAVIDKLGIDINEWARKKLGKAEPPPAKEAPEVAELRAKVQAMEEQRAREDAERKAAEATATYEQVKQKTIADIDAFIQNDDKYEFTRSRKASSLVFSTIEEHFKRTGRLLSFDEAATAVESHFEEDAQQYAGVSKFLAKLAPQGVAEKTASKQESSGTRANAKPVSSNSSAPDRVPTSSARLTRDERRARAIAHLNGAAPAKR